MTTIDSSSFVLVYHTVVRRGIEGEQRDREVVLCHVEMEEDWAVEAMVGGAGPGGFATTSLPRTTDLVS